MPHSIFLTTLLLGWGAAVPFGPINLEMMRRTLNGGFWQGFSLGLGACLADITYVVLLLLGAFALSGHALFLKLLGLGGSFILLWFGYQAFTAKVNETRGEKSQVLNIEKPPILAILEGYGLTLVNPFTLLFWASVSSQLMALTVRSSLSTLGLAVFGVCVGTFSWVTLFNGVLNLTRHRLTPRLMNGLNKLGGGLLCCFALAMLYKACLLPQT